MMSRPASLRGGSAFAYDVDRPGEARESRDRLGSADGFKVCTVVSRGAPRRESDRDR